MPRVLLLDDEIILREMMARGLAKLSGVVVVQAGTVDEALALIDEAAPDVVVSDIDLPGRSGLELIGELTARHLRIPIVFVTAYLSAFRAQIPRHREVELLEKPVELERLRDAVRAHLVPSAPTDGAAPFGVADYLQLAGMGRHSVELTVRRHRALLGTVRVWRGQAWSADDALGSGVDAFRRLAFASDAVVHCATLAVEPTSRNLEGGLEWVLLEAARAHDEGGKASEPGAGAAPSGPVEGDPLASVPPPPLESDHATRTSGLSDEGVRQPVASVPAPGNGSSGVRTAVAPRPGARSPLAAGGFTSASPPVPTREPLERRAFQQAWDEGVEALLRKDYPAAVVAFQLARALVPDDPKVNANLERLRQLGFVADKPGSAEGGRSA